MSDALLEIFTAFCAFGAGRRLPERPEMDSARWMKLCRDLRLLDGTFTPTDADLLFQRTKPLRSRRVSWESFVDMFCEVSRRRGLAPEDLEALALRAGGRPRSRSSGAGVGGGRGGRSAQQQQQHASNHISTSTRPSTSIVGSASAPLRGDTLPSRIGRVLPWESPNWAVGPHLTAHQGWRPGGTTEPPPAAAAQAAAAAAAAGPSPLLLEGLDVDALCAEALAGGGGGVGEGLVKGAAAASVFRSLSHQGARGGGAATRGRQQQQHAERRAVMMSPPVSAAARREGAGGGGASSLSAAAAVVAGHPFAGVGSLESPLRGARLPKEIGRVLPWESPNWRSAPRRSDVPAV